jgi:nitroreductase
MEFYEVLHTQRAIRRFKPDPVPEATLWKILDTAIRAPSSANVQPWAWLVIRDAAKRKAIGDAIRERAESSGNLGRMRQRAVDDNDPTNQRIWRGASELLANVSQAPVLIIPCLYNAAAPNQDQRTLSGGSSIYPAVQNLMLAARAEGLGTVLTGFQGSIEEFLRKELHIPPGAVMAGLIPLGYPDNQLFGPTTRKPIESVAYWDGWGVTRVRG